MFLNYSGCDRGPGWPLRLRLRLRLRYEWWP